MNESKDAGDLNFENKANNEPESFADEHRERADSTSSRGSRKSARGMSEVIRKTLEDE